MDLDFAKALSEHKFTDEEKMHMARCQTSAMQFAALGSMVGGLGAYALINRAKRKLTMTQKSLAYISFGFSGVYLGLVYSSSKCVARLATLENSLLGEAARRSLQKDHPNHEFPWMKKGAQMGAGATAGGAGGAMGDPNHPRPEDGTAFPHDVHRDAPLMEAALADIKQREAARLERMRERELLEQERLRVENAALRAQNIARAAERQLREKGGDDQPGAGAGASEGVALAATQTAPTTITAVPLESLRPSERERILMQAGVVLTRPTAPVPAASSGEGAAPGEHVEENSYYRLREVARRSKLQQQETHRHAHPRESTTPAHASHSGADERERH